MMRRMAKNGNARCTQQKETTHKRGEHNYRRDCEIHWSLSTVPEDQPWQEYDDPQSGGLAGRQRLLGPKREETRRKKRDGR